MKIQKRKSGASTTEYGLLMGLIAVAIVVAVKATGDEVEATFNQVTTQLNIETGQSGTGATPTPATPISCKQILDRNPSAASGPYQIDPDGTGEITVDCDMTTSGGGWTKLIAGTGTTQSALLRFPVIFSNISSYTSNSNGISWGERGTSPQFYDRTTGVIEFNFSYSAIYITSTGYYDNPTGGLGKLQLFEKGQSSDIYQSDDAWSSANTGQSLFINGSAVFERQQTNIVNRTDIISASGNNLSVKMVGYSGVPYTRRYIRDLWYR